MVMNVAAHTVWMTAGGLLYDLTSSSWAALMRSTSYVTLFHTLLRKRRCRRSTTDSIAILRDSFDEPGRAVPSTSARASASRNAVVLASSLSAAVMADLSFLAEAASPEPPTVSMTSTPCTGALASASSPLCRSVMAAASISPFTSLWFLSASLKNSTEAWPSAAALGDTSPTCFSRSSDPALSALAALRNGCTTPPSASRHCLCSSHACASEAATTSRDSAETPSADVAGSATYAFALPVVAVIHSRACAATAAVSARRCNRPSASRIASPKMNSSMAARTSPMSEQSLSLVARLHPMPTTAIVCELDAINGRSRSSCAVASGASVGISSRLPSAYATAVASAAHTSATCSEIAAVPSEPAAFLISAHVGAFSTTTSPSSLDAAIVLPMAADTLRVAGGSAIVAPLWQTTVAALPFGRLSVAT
mmetsp:Transcript_10516/g.32672  ORF Transcript_10516/g.32672 Transcript_10516/m.32672 type:complete len:424 (+) Transcript_10516:531-1802(+)